MTQPLSLSVRAARKLKNLLPRFSIIGNSQSNAPHDQLFDGSDILFKEVVSKSVVYAEYGCGASTIWMGKNTDATIYSVDTSEDWAKTTNNSLAEARPTPSEPWVEWIDVGDVGDWGTPLSYKRRDNFSKYFESPWQRELMPDTVLIDGRFRVACFLTALIRSNPGSKLLFDDYVNRPIYHVVENYCPIQETYGRQALFITPTNLDINAVKEELKNFFHVMD